MIGDRFKLGIGRLWLHAPDKEMTFLIHLLSWMCRNALTSLSFGYFAVFPAKPAPVCFTVIEREVHRWSRR